MVTEKQSFYPFLLAYSAVATITCVMVMAVYVCAPSTSDPTLSPDLAIYAITDEARKLLVTAHIGFTITPIILFFDMANRIVRLIKSGTEAEKARKRV